MTVAVQVPSQSIVAANGQTVFPFTFRCDDSTLMRAWIDDILQGGLQVALNADQDNNPGGTITFAAQSIGAIVTIERTTPQEQDLDIGAYNPFTAAALMRGLDKLVETIQEFWTYILRAPVHTRKNAVSIASTDLPAPVAGYALGWVRSGVKWVIGNVLSSSVTGTGVAGTLVKNEHVGTGDGVTAAYDLAYVPIDNDALVDPYIGGARYRPPRWARVGKTITFAGGYIPPAGEEIYADYYKP